MSTILIAITAACTTNPATEPGRTPVASDAGKTQHDATIQAVDIGSGARVLLSDPTATVTASTAQPPPSPASWKPLSPPVSLNLVSGSIGNGATIEFPVPANVDPADVGVATYDESARQWVPVDHTLRPDGRVVSVSTTHFSWWQFWTWDWAGIGAGVNQRAGQAVGKRAGPPSCDAARPAPAWVSTLIGVESGDAISIRACAQSEGSVLDIQLVNNRPYGQVVTFGAPVRWSWHAPGSSGADVGFAAVMDAIVGSKGLYLPPLANGSIGILPIPPGSSAEFRGGLTKASMLIDVLRVAWGPLTDGIGKALGAELVTSCGARLLELQAPNSYTSLDAVRSQLVDSVDCAKAAFLKMVAKGLLDKHQVTELAATLDVMKRASAIGWVLRAYDVEWKLLDVLVDTRLAAPSVPFGNGFKVIAKTDPTLAWLFSQRRAGYANSGTKRSYTDSGTHPDSTSFWVGCEGRASVTTFSLPEGARRVAGMLTLDPAITPRDLVVTVSARAASNTSQVTLTPGQQVALDLPVEGASQLELSALKSGGTCGASSIGYGVVVDGRFTR